MNQPMPLKQAIDKVIAQMSGIISRKEIVAAVLKHYATKTKDPASSITLQPSWFHPFEQVLQPVESSFVGNDSAVIPVHIKDARLC